METFYLHSPDHKTPIVKTLEAVNDLYQEGRFKVFGLSNYAAWQVAEVHFAVSAKLNKIINSFVFL